ncbi:hypothetical protein HDU76_013527 [Blyttiomyces sp. JEL0837]|nr:hypothetical protein HDU76_013527 [Blyttiomyces sp. JEL0837]
MPVPQPSNATESTVILAMRVQRQFFRVINNIKSPRRRPVARRFSEVSSNSAASRLRNRTRVPFSVIVTLEVFLCVMLAAGYGIETVYKLYKGRLTVFFYI